MDCGKSYPSYVMDFDHREQDKKKFEISTFGTKCAERVLSEIQKCDLVCANCHRVRTYGKNQFQYFKEDDCFKYRLTGSL